MLPNRYHITISAILLAATAPLSAETTISHGIALHGHPKYPANYAHLDYVNPDAPKGGTLHLNATGTFDSFNPFILKGKEAFGSLFLHDTLLNRTVDEPLSKYGVIVSRIERPDDNRWVAFTLNPKARFQDGAPITAADIVFSFKTLLEKGSPFWRQFYTDVDSVNATSPDRVLFTFKTGHNRELPFILGQMPVLAEHWWRHRDFSHSGLQPPVGSGPYRIADFQPGRYVVYERVKDYWAADHPFNRGRYNFDRVRVDYFRDQIVALEAFNNGSIDIRIEENPRHWLQGYNKKMLLSGDIVREKHRNQNPQTLSLVFNARKPLLKDRPLREAITWLLEPDWMINHLLHDEFNRALSLFAGTDLSLPGMPGPEEKALLTPYQDALPKNLFTTPWHPAPASQSSRQRLTYAHQILQTAGYRIDNNQLTTPLGESVHLELLLHQPELERLFQGQRKRLTEAGILLNIRTIDSALYLNRVRQYDYDVIVHTFRHTPSPGTEQCNFWHSGVVNIPGSLNMAAINNPAVDALCTSIPQAVSRAALKASLNAMERTILWQYQVIPLFYMPDWHIAYHARLRHPDTLPGYGIDLTTWWLRTSEDQRLD
ncbi:extracellular solute-binding protein [Kistimonas scapharcae]|uniref:Extracellular solute-binding protein n=1 Tax=Kistimonas scapharcae TaxID=1036133 RepID=A0ABP8UYZ9_9GAMM